ncbi:DUF3617 family protein [Hydrogenophaga palleronii]|nr:DUF3617 family protein [Hydrogenophaga palleronii]
MRVGRPGHSIQLPFEGAAGSSDDTFVEAGGALAATIALPHILWAGVMSPGQWEIRVTIESATGPGASMPPPAGPMVQRACKAQSFVDKENYTSTDFAMGRPRRNQFQCRVDSREGDAREARWQFTCERSDGLHAVTRAVNKVSADRLEQVATETMTRDGEPWSEVTVRVDGKLTGQACQEEDIQLK